MAGSAASLAISASASAVRSFSVAICWSAPAERVCQRSRSSPIAACRSVRARCSRSSVMSSVRLSVTRERRSAAAVCAAARSASRASVPPSAARAASVSDEVAMRLGERVLGAALGVGDGGDLGFRLARLTLHGGQHLAGLRQLGLRLAPELAQPLLLGLRGRQPLRRRLGGGARAPPRRGAPRPPARASAPSRLRSASRVAAAVDTCGGGDEAVPAPQVALARDQALAGPQGALQPGAVRGGDDADLAQAARQLGRAFHVRDERLDAGRQGRVGFALRR